MRIRTMRAEDRFEVAELIRVSLNFWYQMHGRPAIFSGGAGDSEVFYDVYSVLDPGCGVVAENAETGRLMGSCFYHPREHHVSLGIMNVHPNYFGCGVGRALVDYIIEYTERGGFRALRLIQSALNLDSFSLYNRAGFVPRCAYQDMVIQVPGDGIKATAPGVECVRDAAPGDVDAMAALEFEVSGITRRQDYRYAIENSLGIWHAAVFESPQGRIDGFMISSGHAAVNILGPSVARSERQAAALLVRELERYKGRTPVTLVPVECEKLVRQMYDWGARNCELHFGQVRGAFQAFRGVNLPAFLPETG